jgi:hypothetical protein
VPGRHSLRRLGRGGLTGFAPASQQWRHQTALAVLSLGWDFARESASLVATLVPALWERVGQLVEPAPERLSVQPHSTADSSLGGTGLEARGHLPVPFPSTLPAFLRRLRLGCCGSRQDRAELGATGGFRWGRGLLGRRPEQLSTVLLQHPLPRGGTVPDPVESIRSLLRERQRPQMV